MKQNQIALTVVLVLIAGAGAFFAGMKYQQMQRGQMMGQGTGRMQFASGGQNRMMQRNGQAPVIGEIITQDDKSITVKMPDGSSKIIILSKSTGINKQASGSASDLKTGVTVLVIGSSNADGSITAQNIQLNSQGRGMMRTAKPQ